jgi:hypothetical protein
MFSLLHPSPARFSRVTADLAPFFTDCWEPKHRSSSLLFMLLRRPRIADQVCSSTVWCPSLGQTSRCDDVHREIHAAAYFAGFLGHVLVMAES